MVHLTESHPIPVLLLVSFFGQVCPNEFDFGLMENEPLLEQLFKEDRNFLQEMDKINERSADNILHNFLKEEFNSSLMETITAKDFVQHPINALHMIRRNAVLVPQLLLKITSQPVIEEVKRAYEATELLK